MAASHYKYYPLCSLAEDVMCLTEHFLSFANDLNPKKMCSLCDIERFIGKTIATKLSTTFCFSNSSTSEEGKKV